MHLLLHHVYGASFIVYLTSLLLLDILVVSNVWDILRYRYVDDISLQRTFLEPNIGEYPWLCTWATFPSIYNTSNAYFKITPPKYLQKRALPQERCPFFLVQRERLLFSLTLFTNERESPQIKEEVQRIF